MRGWKWDILVVDLETTDEENDNRIIEIGASLIFRAEDRPWQLVDYRCFVNPERPLSDHVKEITGYDDAMLETAVGIEKGLEWLDRIVLSPKKVRLGCWGNYFDVNVLRREYARVGRHYPWSGTVIDVKTLALAWLAVSGRRTDSASLETVANHMGIGLRTGERYHTAVTDARVTAEVFCRVMADFATSVWIPDPRGYKQVNVTGV